MANQESTNRKDRTGGDVTKAESLDVTADVANWQHSFGTRVPSDSSLSTEGK